VNRALALILTALTGFSGLVYEVTWQKYLATLLGSHSEATAAVLAIFLGGLSLGYWLFGRLTRRLVAAARDQARPPRLLLVYGLLEGSIGIYVLAFPWLFEAVRALSFAISHGASGSGFVTDVGLTILLIGPASVMMGGTIPILTQALARSLEDATRFHAFVYAFNTVGAFVGALAAGFYLIPTYGLVRVMLFMGLINLTAGAIFITLGRLGQPVVSLEQDTTMTGPGAGGMAAYYVVALLTGFAMMTLQTSAIRIAGLSFGSSQFTFSMVVAVFVLCIALGSFLVSALPKISLRWVTGNQWALFVAFLLLYFQVEKSPYWVQMLRSIFRDDDASFAPYYAAAFLAVLALIGLPVLLSGAVLPLLFHSMRREADHLGDMAGRLYGWNTVGSLAGALFGGYVLFYWFDLHEVYRIAVGALAIGAVVLSIRAHRWHPVVAMGMLFVSLVGLFVLPTWDHRFLHAGLFRERQVLPGRGEGFEAFMEKNSPSFHNRTAFHTDDPIASVRAYEIDHGEGVKSLSIAVNGKSDGNTRGDFVTMSLVATLPTMFAEKAERAFVVGWGTGITAGQLAAFDSIQRVEVAEISPGVIEASPLFDFANLGASSNPKIEVLESDAYRALVRSDQQYDVIVSEPSNPWVTGIEMLYSRDFLEVAKSKLHPGGVFAQWFHEYETDGNVMEIVLRTYASVFDHVAIWHSKTPDLFLIGFMDAENALDETRLERQTQRPDFAAALASANIHSFPELLVHEILPLGVVHALDLDGPDHTLYHPILADAAGRAFFRGGFGFLPFSGYAAPAEIGARNSLLRRYIARIGGRLPDLLRERVFSEACRAHGPVCYTILAQWMNEDPASPAFQRSAARWRQAVERGKQIERSGQRLFEVPENLAVMSALFDHVEMSAEENATSFLYLRTAKQASREFEKFYFHAAPFRADTLRTIWSRCGELVPNEADCRERVTRDPRSTEDPERETAFERCMQMLTPGRACFQGSRHANALLTHGVPTGEGPDR